eukprot:TRINITY_DN9488_c0_g1_i1.p1 TRINITY_DN9488_c0_g1~~TRINITY_DN9488_c0_g1_i1.p1  ORF type:complete len:725 (-),score=159.02 TRINITY_DN9488_c0_g1_i1:105-2279(-)
MTNTKKIHQKSNAYTCSLLVLLSTIILVDCQVATEEFVYVGCGVQCLEDAVKTYSTQIESFYAKFLEDLKILVETLVSMDANGDMYAVKRLNLSVGATFTDQFGGHYWGDKDPARVTELFVTNYSTYKILDDSRITTPESYYDNSITLKDSPRNITQFCEKFHPVTNSSSSTNYQPYYCRNPSLFDYDMVRASVQYFTVMQNIMIGFKKLRTNVVAYYSVDIYGTTGYYPTIEGDDLGNILGGDDVFPIMFYVSPKVNPARLAVYGPPYADDVGTGFIVTAIAPVYFGDFWWGSMCADISMGLIQKSLEGLKPTPHTFTLLVDDTGLVILGSELAYNKLFNLSPATRIEDQSVISYVQYNASILNISYIWEYEIRSTSAPEVGQINTTLINNGTRYKLQYSRLSNLKNWALLVFSPFEELYPHKTILEVSDESSTALLTFSLLFLTVPIAFVIVIVLKWDSHTVSPISPPFTLASVVGTILLILSPIFLSNFVQNCMAWLWLLTVGYVLFFGGFLVKTYRIERIFSLGEKKFKKAKKLKNHHIFPRLLFLLLIQIIYLTAWTIVAPLEVVHYESDSSDDVITVSCGTNNPVAFWGFFGPEAAYVVIIMIVSCYYSFKTKDVYLKEFKEAKQILFAVYNFSFAAILISVVASLIHSTPSATFLVVGLGTVLATTISLIVWLGPRMLRALQGKESGSSSGGSQDNNSSQNEKPSQSNSSRGAATTE